MAVEATMAVSANTEEPNMGCLRDLDLLNSLSNENRFKDTMSDN
jgi:hypothetical protein